MAFVSIAQAADMVRKQQADLYRDVDGGLLQATRSSDGALLLDTSELLRVYGIADTDALSPEQLKIAVLEERTRALERALALEAELRRVKDQVANELRARLADKESVIKALESKVMFLEDDQEIPTLTAEEDAEEAHPQAKPEPNELEEKSGNGWWSRLTRQKPDSSLPK